MNDELLIDVLRAAGHEDAAVLAAKVLEAREPQAPEPEGTVAPATVESRAPVPEPEPVAPSAAPAASSLDAYVLEALRRDIPRLAPPPTASVDADRGEAA